MPIALYMHPVSEPLAAATRASITLPHSERPLFIGKHLLVQVQNAFNDADDTNLDDIDDDDDAERPPMAIGPPPEMICVLSGLDDRLAEALRAGDIKLLRVSWLRRLRGPRAA